MGIPTGNAREVFQPAASQTRAAGFKWLCCPASATAPAAPASLRRQVGPSQRQEAVGSAVRSEVLVSASAGGAGVQNRSAGSPPADAQQAADAVRRFCQDVPATRVAPTAEELDALWAHLALDTANCFGSSQPASAAAQRAAVADALTEQLAYGCEGPWQPQFRALRLLAYLYEKGEGGRRLAAAAMEEAGGLIEHLASTAGEVQAETQEEASRLLLVRQLTGVLPPGQEVAVANSGGLLHFTRADASSASPQVSTAALQSVTRAAGATQADDFPDLLSWSPREASTTPPPPSTAAAALSAAPPVRRSPAAPGIDAHCGWGGEEASKSGLAGGLGYELPELLAAAFGRSPEVFNIGEDEGGQPESSELDDMFSFAGGRREARPTPSVSFDLALSPTLQSRSPDPFAFVAAHVGLAS